MFSAFLWSQKKTTGFSWCCSLVIIRFWVETRLQVFRTVTYQSAHFPFKNVYHPEQLKTAHSFTLRRQETVCGLIVAMQHGASLWSCFCMLSRRTDEQENREAPRHQAHIFGEQKLQQHDDCQEEQLILCHIFNEHSKIYTQTNNKLPTPWQ